MSKRQEKLKIKLLHPKAKLPSRQTAEAAGLDLYAVERARIPAGKRAICKLGIAAVIPKGHAVLFWDRSGLAAKRGLTLLGGVIDSDYRGEWALIVLNTSREAVTIEAGERIAQALIQRIEPVTVVEVDELPVTKRGKGGFGSTGR